MHYQLATPSPVRHQPATRRGFNLVEAAIVLGVVGLVIGGIWVAASALQKNMTINNLANQISFMADCTRKFITPDQTVNAYQFLPASGCMPGDMSVWTSPHGTTFRNAYSEFLYVYIIGDGYIRFYFQPRSVADCNQLVNTLVSRFGSSGEYLAKVNVLTMSGPIDYLPTDFSTSINKCPSGTIDQNFYFVIPGYK